MDIDNLVGVPSTSGTSGAQKRNEPESDITVDDNAGTQKKSKTQEETDENVGDLNHLVHAELDYLRSLIDNDSLAKRLTVALRKDLTGSYNRICSVVRDITYQHAKMEGAYEEMLKNTKQAAAPNRHHDTVRTRKEGSYADALRTGEPTNGEPARTSVHDRLGKKPNKQKGKGSKVLQPKVVSTPTPEPMGVHNLEQTKETTEGTFRIVGSKKNKPKVKMKSTIDLTQARKAQTLPKFTLKDSVATEEQPKLWESFWIALRGRLKNPRLAVHRSRTKGPTILVPDNKETLDSLRGMEIVSEIIPRRPRLTLKGMDSSLTDAEVIRELIECNPELGLSGNDSQDIRVVYHSGPKSDVVTDLVIEVSPKILRQIEGKKAYIGGIRSTLNLNHSVSQCFKCQKYGHTAKNCREEQSTCRNCAENHDSRSCKVKDNFKCCNCKGMHKASSDGCPTKTAALKRLAKRTDYGQPLKTGSSEENQK